MLVYLSLLLFYKNNVKRTCIAQLLFKSLCLVCSKRHFERYTQQQHHKQRCMCSLRSCYLREKSFMGVEGSGLFNVIWLKSIHTFTFIVTVFTASASIRVSARNASLYIAVMIFCAQPYLKPCFMCPFYILSTCPPKGLCSALLWSDLSIYMC